MQSEQYAVIDKVFMPHVLGFITGKLAEFDTTMLEWIKLLPLSGKAILHGCCTYPVRSRPRARSFKSGYRIRASVNVELAPPYVYSHWGRIPSADFKQGWYSGEQSFVFHDLEECAVHTLAHECFHFLSHAKQVSLKNTEANANWMADRWLEEFSLMRVRTEPAC
jgi:hypothetical protein